MTEKTPGEWSYEQFAERYAEIVQHKPDNAYHEAPATRRLIPPVEGRRVLDAGCGPGYTAAWLLEQGAAHVTAVDVTPDFVRMAGDHLAAYGDRVTVDRADISQPLDFAADHTFDVVVSQLVLHYIADWSPVCAEFARILKPGGWLVFSTGHPFGDWLYASRVLGQHSYFEQRRFDAQWAGFGDPPPMVRSYRRPLMDVLNPVLDAGFRLDHILEPQPVPAYAEVAPQDYDSHRTRPIFLCVRAQKPHS